MVLEKLNEQMHIAKADAATCEVIAKKTLDDIEIKARCTDNHKFITCARLIYQPHAS